MFGTKLFPGVGYPTPVSIPDDTTCLVLHVPASAEWWALVVGLLYTLTLEWDWQQFEDGIERDDAAARWKLMLEDALEVASTTNTCAVPEQVDTPFWDNATDVDDEDTPELQPWYGYVTDPAAPAGELTFIEDVSVWAFTGLLAVGVDVGLAIAFNTIAPRFVLAMRSGDVAEIIRIVVDNEDVARVDTSLYATNTIIEQPILADPALETHQIYIIREE